jgi:hypothetical protein
MQEAVNTRINFSDSAATAHKLLSHQTTAENLGQPDSQTHRICIKEALV